MDTTFSKTIRSYTGRYIDEFKVLASLGQLTGLTYFRKFGSNDNGSTTEREILDFYTGGSKTYNGWYETNTQLYLISSSASDTTQTIVVTGVKEVDGLWVETVEEFPLTGTTAVDIGSWLRVLRLRVVAPHDLLMGDIYATTETSVPNDSDDIACAIMLKDSGDSKNTSKTCIYTTPSDKAALLEKVFVSSISNKVAIFEFYIRPRGGDWLSIADFAQEGTNQLETNYQYIPPETDIKLSAYYESGTGKVAGSLHMYIVDSDKFVS